MKITIDLLKKVCPYAKDSIITDLVKYFNIYSPDYLVNSVLRISHFLAQAAHESAGFRTLEEYASGSAYEGRKDLGNTQVGDGKKYKGRGIFQLTGRSNYTIMGTKLGKDLINNPTLAATPEISVLTALNYWKDRYLNKYADLDDIKTVTRRINGGYNGLEDRTKYLTKFKTLINNQAEIPL